MAEIIEYCSKFNELDAIYQNNTYLDDNLVVDILKKHRSLEERYVTDVHSQKPIESPLYGEYFHKENIEIIDYLIENIDSGYQRVDVLIYMYPLMIHRYSSGSFGDSLPTVEKFQKYFDKVRVVLNTKSINIGFIYASLIRFFTIRKIHSYSQEFVDQIFSVNNNNLLYTFRYCCILLYDKEFCRSQYHYDGAMHKGSYILFDTVLHGILYGRGDEKQKWVNKFVDFFENNKDIQFDTMPNYYLVFAQLYKCFYLSSDSENLTAELKQCIDSIKLPDFEAGENCLRLYYLYHQKLNCLENFNDNDSVLETCNYLLEILQNTDFEYADYYAERINWRKYAALKALNSPLHEDWFFGIIDDSDFNNVGNMVYLSPFMIQDDNASIDSLYHYTDLLAMKSIIENKALWLTRYDFLNDMEEIKYISSIIDIAIENITDKNFRQFIRECLDLLNDYFNDTIEGDLLTALKNSISNIYVLSTSKKEDNLSMWHYYAGGAGCSVKIDTLELRKQIEGRNPSVSNKNAQVFMREIDYGYDFMESELLKSIRTIYGRTTLSLEQRKFLVCVHIIYEGIFTKNSKMSQEEEFRVAVIVGNEPEYTTSRITPKFRVRDRNTFIPYIELIVDSQALIQEICIAPLNKTDIAKKGLQEFLKHNSFEASSEMVRVSDIKLRY